MSKLLSAAAALVVGLFMVGIFAAPVNALQTGTSASAPTWHVGDSWAMGKEIDYGSEMTDNITMIKQMAKSALNMTVNELSIDAKAGYYATFKVTGETGTAYIVNAKLAVKMAAQIDVQVTGSMPKAGTYSSAQNPMSPYSTVAKETKTMSLDASEKFGFVVDTYAYLNKTTFAVQNMTVGLRSALVFDLSGGNIPQVNETDDDVTISYKDYDVGLDLVAGLNLSVDFNPALDIYQFPIDVGYYNGWYINKTEVTVAGDVSGFLNIHGLPDDIKQEIFTEDLVNVTGSTDFPITFDHLTSPDGAITDGHFGPYSYNTTAKWAYCSQVINQTVNGIQRDIYVIKVDGEKNKLYYSPGYNFITGVDAPADLGQVSDLTSGLPVPDVTDEVASNLPVDPSMITSVVGGQNVQMDPVTVESATASINAISDYTESVKSQANAGGSSSSNSLGDFFLKAPYTGVIMVVISAIVIAALLFYGLRVRKH